MEFKINNSVVSIREGDICQSACDVVVSSDDSFLSHGGGVSMAIARTGGSDIVRDARKQVPVALGDVVVTTAGSMKQKYVFHAVTIDVERWGMTCNEDVAELRSFIIRNSVTRCFQLVSSLKLGSIAFPMIGSGVAGIPNDVAARNLAAVVCEQLLKTNRQLSVEIWLFGSCAEQSLSVLQSVFASNGSEFSSGEVLSGMGSLASAVVPGLGSLIGSEWLSKLFQMGEKCPEFRSESPMCDQVDARPEPSESREVFVSYSRKDINAARRICELLDQMGASYWIDLDGISGGENYKRKIVRAIRDVKFFIFLSSASSNASPNVKKEIALAVSENKHIIPIRLDNTPFDDEIAYDITSLDYIDASAGSEATAKKLRNTILAGRMNRQRG